MGYIICAIKMCTLRESDDKNRKPLKCGDGEDWTLTLAQEMSNATDKKRIIKSLIY